MRNGNYNVAVVGAGVIGTSIVSKFDDSLSVVLIESGVDDTIPAIQSLSEVDKSFGALNKFHLGVHSQRVYGGNWQIWGGVCGVFDERSFNLDWPITYSELFKYYKPAGEIFGIPAHFINRRESDSTDHLADGVTYRSLYRIDTDKIFKQVSKVTELNNVDKVIGKTLFTIKKSETGYTLVLKDSLSGVVDTINCEVVILAAGGFGNVQVLQNLGIKNAGKYFSEHPHIYDSLTIDVSKKFLPKYSPENSLYHVLKPTGFPDTKSTDDLNMSIVFNSTDGVSKKTLIAGKLVEALSYPAYLLYEPYLMAENEVLKTAKKNALGFNTYNVKYETPKVKELKHSLQKFATQLLKHGIARIRKVSFDSYSPGGGHLMTTTRMGFGNDSILNKNAELNGFRNIYLCGSSVFSTPGVANPTLTALALALKVVDCIHVRYGINKKPI